MVCTRAKGRFFYSPEYFWGLFLTHTKAPDLGSRFPVFMYLYGLSFSLCLMYTCSPRELPGELGLLLRSVKIWNGDAAAAFQISTSTREIMRIPMYLVHYFSSASLRALADLEITERDALADQVVRIVSTTSVHGSTVSQPSLTTASSW